MVFKLEDTGGDEWFRDCLRCPLEIQGTVLHYTRSPIRPNSIQVIESVDLEDVTSWVSCSPVIINRIDPSLTDEEIRSKVKELAETVAFLQRDKW